MICHVLIHSDRQTVSDFLACGLILQIARAHPQEGSQFSNVGRKNRPNSSQVFVLWLLTTARITEAMQPGATVEHAVVASVFLILHLKNSS